MTAQAGAQASESKEECIQNCLDCHRICLEMVTYSLRLGGGHAEVEHIGLLLDCAEICRVSADFIIRGSEIHRRICGVCFDICDRCAADCERMGADDAHLTLCAEACRRAAESCRQMANPAATG